MLYHGIMQIIMTITDVICYIFTLLVTVIFFLEEDITGLLQHAIALF